MTSARGELARRLDALYTAAGSPPLKAISARATREVRARNPRGREVSAQRVSDWRLGRSVPAKFDGLSAVLGVLIPAARQHEPEPALPGLYSMPGWHTPAGVEQQDVAGVGAGHRKGVAVGGERDVLDPQLVGERQYRRDSARRRAGVSNCGTSPPGPIRRPAPIR